MLLYIPGLNKIVGEMQLRIYFFRERYNVLMLYPFSLTMETITRRIFLCIYKAYVDV